MKMTFSKIKNKREKEIFFQIYVELIVERIS